MSQENWIKLLSLIDWRKSLSFLLRYLYPGTLLILFVWCRYNEFISSSNLFFIFTTNTINTTLLILILGLILFTSGAAVYFIHRALFHPFIILIEKNTVGVPQYEFHKTVVDELKAPLWVMKIKIVQGCINEVIRTKASPEDRAERWLFNSSVHFLLMNSLLCFLAFLHNIIFLGTQARLEWLWLVTFVLFLIAGIATDYFWADERETSFLMRHKEEYKKVLRQRIK